MAYLTLSDPTTDSCHFKVKLSNPFNKDYYKRLRITKTDYDDSTSSVGSYLEDRTASSSSSASEYVRGIVNEGLRAGRTYTLYAYAQAKNGTWYLAGSDDITMKDEESKEIDLGIRDIYYKYRDSDDDYELAEDGTVFETGREISFKIQVKNYTDIRKPYYTVSVYDENDVRLGRETGEKPATDHEINNAYVNITVDDPGEQELTFAIILEDSRWIDTDDRDNTRYRTYTWEKDDAMNFVNIALDEVGYKEKSNNITKYGEWYGLQNQWCHMFVSWCANEAGILNELVPKTASTVDGSKWFKNKNKYKTRESGYSPKAGDVVYFYSESKGRIGHVGIVVAYDKDSDTLYTVEGNASDKVSLLYYRNMRENGYVVCFGLVGGTNYGNIPSGAKSGKNISIT